MRSNRILLPFVLLYFISIAPPVLAQMKSCCEPDNTKLVSTVKQSAGTLKMVKILDSINTNANPEIFFLMNAARVELFKKKLAVEKDPNKRLEYYFQYCVEVLNAGNTDEALSVLNQMITAMQLTRQNFTAGYKTLFDELAIAYMRKGELENCTANHNAQS